MIRINLLESERAGAGKAKGAGAAGGAAKSTGGASSIAPYVPLLSALAIAALGCGYFYTALSSEIADTNTKIAAAKVELERLQVEKAKLEELERKRKSFTDQVNLIERLKAEQSGPVHMLDELSKALPDFVWLTNITQTGPVLRISGEASTNNAVADYLNNLQRAGDGCDLATASGKANCWFPEANIDSYQETLVGTQAILAFKFTATFTNPEVAKVAAASVAGQKKPTAAPVAPAAK